MRNVFFILPLAIAMSVTIAHAASQRDKEDCGSVVADRSIEACTRLIADSPGGRYMMTIDTLDLARAYYRRGYSYLQTDDFDRAIADFDEAILLDPAHLLSYQQRGYAYLGKGDFENARASFYAVLAQAKGTEFGAARLEAEELTRREVMRATEAERDRLAAMERTALERERAATAERNALAKERAELAQLCPAVSGQSEAR